MAKLNDGTDELIRGNYLQQPSPFSWAQQFAEGNNKNAALMQEMQNRILMAQQQQEHATGLQSERLAAEARLRTGIQSMSDAAALERTKLGIEAKDNEFDVDETGAQTMPSELYSRMPPSAQRKFEHIGTIQKGNKTFVKVRPKGGAAGGNQSLNPNQK